MQHRLRQPVLAGQQKVEVAKILARVMKCLWTFSPLLEYQASQPAICNCNFACIHSLSELLNSHADGLGVQG